jgi:hypothetical protein
MQRAHSVTSLTAPWFSPGAFTVDGEQVRLPRALDYWPRRWSRTIEGPSIGRSCGSLVPGDGGPVGPMRVDEIPAIGCAAPAAISSDAIP